MKKFLLLSLLLLIIQITAFSQQFYIAGTVKDESGKPLDGAEVFLNGTSRLTQSNAEGAFNISRLTAGNYELVAKLLGRETYRANFTLTKSSRFNIILKLKSRQLTEVVIRPNSYSNADYTSFTRTFLGVTPNASKCKILNPNILNIYRDSETKTLHVNSGGEFLIISNPTLGYNVKYLLEEFILDNQQLFSMYAGQALFTEMSGSAVKIAKWKKERTKAYLGSPQHLLKSIYHGNLNPQEFIVRKLRTKPNDRYLSEKEFVIKRDNLDGMLAVKTISRQQHTDSLSILMSRVRLPDYILSVGNDTLQAHSLIVNNSGANKRLNMSESLHIIYLNEKPAIGYHTGTYIEGTKKPDYRFQMSTISLREGQALIDASGNLSDPLSLIFNGYMGWERVADMLPKDYAY